MSDMPTDPEDKAPTPRVGSLRNILLNTGWMLGGKGISAVLSLAYLALATRTLGLEGFGQFALVLGMARGVAGLVNFQSWQIVVRYGMEHIHAGRDDALKRLVHFSAFLDVASGIVGAAIVTVGLLVMGPHLGWDHTFTMRAIATSVVLVLAVQSTATGVLRLHDRFGDATGAETIIPVTRFFGSLIVWAINPSVIGFLIVWSLSEAMSATTYWLLAGRFQKIDWLRLPRFDWPLIREDNPKIAGYAVTTNLASSLTVGGKQLSVLLVGLLVSPAAAGGFRVAQQLADAMSKLSTMLSRAIFPELMRSRAGDAGEGRNFEKLFRRTRRLAMIGAGAVIVLLLVVGRPLLGLIAGKDFLPVYPLLLTMGVAAAIDFAAISFEPALVAHGHAGQALAIRSVAAAVLLGLIFALTPMWQGLGASFAVLASSVLSFTMFWIALKRLKISAPRPSA